MGADLILGYAWTTREPAAIDFAAGAAAIETIGVDDIESGAFDEDWEDPNGDEGDDVEPWMAAVVRPQLRADWAEIRDLWSGARMYRDTTRVTFGPVTALITGGMSWGDDPSETFGLITRVPEVVYRAAGFFE